MYGAKDFREIFGFRENGCILIVILLQLGILQSPKYQKIQTDDGEDQLFCLIPIKIQLRNDFIKNKYFSKL